MANPQAHTTRILRLLEVLLRERGQPATCELITRIADGLGRSGDFSTDLLALARVKGLETFAMRLMWFAESAEAAPGDVIDDEVCEYQSEQLLSDLRSMEIDEGIGAGRKAQATPRDLESAVEKFCASVDNVCRHAFDGGEFVALRRSTLDGLLLETDRLIAAALGERNSDVEEFCRAFSGFTKYILDGNLVNDVRVVNFMENASLTLRTAFNTVGADDYDSLHQTTLLLKKPDTILDITTSAEPNQ